MALLTTDNGMTIAQFMNESKYFDKSQEYYDLLREASELDLMATFIDSQDFLAEGYVDNPDEYGLMMEADEKTTENVKDKWYNKVGNFFKKIGTAILKALKALGTFIKHAYESWADTASIKKINELAVSINKSLDSKPDLVGTVSEKTSEGVTKATEGFKHERLLSVSHTGMNVKEATELYKLFDRLYSDKGELFYKLTMMIKLVVDKVEINMPVGLNNFKELAQQLVKVVNAAGNKKKAEEQAKELDAFITKINDANKKEIKSDISSLKLNEYYKTVNKAYTSIEKVIRGKEDVIQNGRKVKDGTEGGYGANGTKLVEALKKFLNETNAILEALRKLLSYRHDSANRLKKILTIINKSVKSGGKGSNKSDDKKSDDSKSETKSEEKKDEKKEPAAQETKTPETKVTEISPGGGAGGEGDKETTESFFDDLDEDWSFIDD